MSLNSNSISIKATVHSFFPDARVILFGSRARGDNNLNSDYDVLVVTKTTLPEKEKFSFAGKIHKALVYLLRAPVDVLLNSEEEVIKKSQLPGHVVQWATKEGKEL